MIQPRQGAGGQSIVHACTHAVQPRCCRPYAVETDAFGTRVCEELIPGGSSIPVTSTNVLQVSKVLACISSDGGAAARAHRIRAQASPSAAAKASRCKMQCCLLPAPVKVEQRSGSLTLNALCMLAACTAAQYVYLVADWHLNKRLGVTASAFRRGLCKVSSEKGRELGLGAGTG